MLIGMKSPWDAYRVASGAERELHSEFDPMMEMTMSKCIELFAESLPGILIQLSSILQSLSTGKSASFVVISSLALSTFPTGFVSATISYDLDTDPKKRAGIPEFYGYVLDSQRKRAALFLTLMNLAAVQALLKWLKKNKARASEEQHSYIDALQHEENFRSSQLASRDPWEHQAQLCLVVLFG